jgi:hypothetical protein
MKKFIDAILLLLIVTLYLLYCYIGFDQLNGKIKSMRRGNG